MAKQQSPYQLSVKINGRKRRSWKLKDGSFTDPFAEHDIFSRTLLPPGTDCIEADSDVDMEIELKLKKNKDIKFKPENLSLESQLKLVDKNLDDRIEKDIKPIGDKPILPITK